MPAFNSTPGFPDVNTMPAGPFPIPIPYPNFEQGAIPNPNQPLVQIINPNPTLAIRAQLNTKMSQLMFASGQQDQSPKMVLLSP
jgi:hypothetical protein